MDLAAKLNGVEVNNEDGGLNHRYGNSDSSQG